MLFLGAIILGLSIHFYIVNRRSLQEAIESSTPTFYKLRFRQENSSAIAKQALPPKREEPKVTVYEPRVPAKTQNREEAVESVEDLKTTIMKQQQLLNGFLKQVEEIEQSGREEMELENQELREEIEELKEMVSTRDAEIDDIQRKADLAESLNSRIEEVYKEFENLQSKMTALEKQAARANNLALELEDTRQSYEQVHKELQRKSERLEETFAENHRLQQQFHQLEDKLAEANLQRQQLQKKVQFLQELNLDMQSVSETNKKLQTELRRIGELESMLNMIAEERDMLRRRDG